MKPFVPEKVKIKPRTVLTVVSLGDPNKVMESYMKALYGTAYSTKMKVYKPLGKIMSIGTLSAFWPDAHLKPKNEWTGIWNIEVPDWVKHKDLLQKDPKIEIKVEKLIGGDGAQILHLGAYSEEGPTIKTLHDFIEKEFSMNMSDIIGNHEEVYLTTPKAKVQKTLIRYLVKK
ncbi:hypothetical protein HGB13_01025 [bacterium]|nr:hypothetical protein [bacterium]